MKTINEIRYENFTNIINNEASSLQEIADKMGKSNAQMSHIKNKVKNIGDKMAREFEEAFDKPHGWMLTTPKIQTFHPHQAIKTMC